MHEGRVLHDHLRRPDVELVAVHPLIVPAPDVMPGCVLVSLERWTNALVLRLGAPMARPDEPPDVGVHRWLWNLRIGEETEVEAGALVCGLRTDVLFVDARFSTTAPALDGRRCVLTVTDEFGSSTTTPFTVPGGPGPAG